MNDADVEACAPYVEIGDCVFLTRASAEVAPGAVGLNGVQRKQLRVSTGDAVKWRKYEPPSREFDCAGMTIELEFTRPALAARLIAKNAPKMMSTETRLGLVASRSWYVTSVHPSSVMRWRR